MADTDPAPALSSSPPKKLAPTPHATALDRHPTAVALRRRSPKTPVSLTLDDVRRIALEAGADDVGAVSLAHPDLAEEVPHVRAALPTARTLVSIVLRTHADDIRSPARSVSNQEFHRTGHEVDEVAHRVALALAARGHRTINPSMAFPMEMDAFPGRTWVVSQKKVAVAAQLGRMGIHRSVIHPRFGSFILLGTVVTEAEIAGEMPPLDFDPCVSCKLCVAACPVGAIEPDGTFRFSACYDHNYREFMTGFTDFIEEVADSKSREDFRSRVTPSESASMWQSLAYQPNYKAAYCIAVCPAGEDVMGPFLADRRAFVADVMKPLTEKVETVYAVAGSDAAAHVQKRFPNKRLKVISSSLAPANIESLFRSLPLTFQRGPAKGWRGTFHFDLAVRGPEGASEKHTLRATVRIDDGTLEVEDGLVGMPDVTVRCSGDLWLDIVAKRRSPVWAVVRRKLKIVGERSLLDRFAACFPR